MICEPRVCWRWRLGDVVDVNLDAREVTAELTRRALTTYFRTVDPAQARVICYLERAQPPGPRGGEPDRNTGGGADRAG
ncbi:MAG: hypothetical protein JO168_18980 [Solirubrobacterales bacterium]|nr:hypothetical protein [Solirubrobacterales bacterium]